MVLEVLSSSEILATGRPADFWMVNPAPAVQRVEAGEH